VGGAAGICKPAGNAGEARNPEGPGRALLVAQKMGSLGVGRAKWRGVARSPAQGGRGG
jgi:hypothetical protein